MTNGHIDDAELDLLLEGSQRGLDRMLVIGMRELRTGMREMKAEVKAMRQVCEQRGMMCPGMKNHIADPVTPPPTKPSEDKRTWAMWGVGTAMLERVVLPVLVVLVTLLVTGGLK